MNLNSGHVSRYCTTGSWLSSHHLAVPDAPAHQSLLRLLGWWAVQGWRARASSLCPAGTIHVAQGCIAPIVHLRHEWPAELASPGRQVVQSAVGLSLDSMSHMEARPWRPRPFCRALQSAKKHAPPAWTRLPKWGPPRCQRWWCGWACPRSACVRGPQTAGSPPAGAYRRRHESSISPWP